MSNWQPNSGQGFSPYSSPSGFPPKDPYAPKPSSPKPWLWIGLAVGGLAMLCCCGGTIGVGMFGMNLITTEIGDKLRDNPKFREHIGELQTISIDWSRSSSTDDSDTFVYNVKGTKGSGSITVKHVSDFGGDEEIVSATLRLPDGTQVPIVP